MTAETNPCLVLSRREGELIHIGDDVTVEVIRVGRTVRLAIRAPRDTAIVRDELKKRSDSASTDSCRPT